MFLTRKSVSHRVIEVPITIEQHARALARHDDMNARIEERYGKKYLRNSIKEGQGTYAGLLLEEVYNDFYYPIIWERPVGKNIFDWDLRNAIFGSADMKAKIQKYSGTPESHYNCTVSDANITQQCDWYFFGRIHVDCEKAWLLGVLPKKLFFKLATFAHESDIDPTSSPANPWRFKWDCWNVPIAKTIPVPRTMDELLALRHNSKYSEFL